ncbi:hypothetical protein LINGRAHAP2_LOCUS13366 [Linum grandiflorum]
MLFIGFLHLPMTNRKNKKKYNKRVFESQIEIRLVIYQKVLEPMFNAEFTDQQDDGDEGDSQSILRWSFFFFLQKPVILLVG